MTTINYRCPNCGGSDLMPESFAPVHFTGKLAPLSEGYCSVTCARLALRKLYASLERVK
jgi:hypothetical protein